uniref:Signal transduction response regulator receiver region domain-containing protein n=1 Tax=uncultured microorganism TaxID=358574 RepID=F8UHS1_9ZZZZ|nr:signal transduction response regulator receiver region domain-containing protein [uncultured microorganism]
MIKILIVDDEKGLCDILKDFFKIYGFDVLIATDGQGAGHYFLDEGLLLR